MRCRIFKKDSGCRCNSVRRGGASGFQPNDPAKSLLCTIGETGCGVAAIQRDGRLEAIEVGNAFRASVEMLFDLAAIRRIELLIEILADVQEESLLCGFFRFHGDI